MGFVEQRNENSRYVCDESLQNSSALVTTYLADVWQCQLFVLFWELPSKGYLYRPNVALRKWEKYQKTLCLACFCEASTRFYRWSPNSEMINVDSHGLNNDLIFHIATSMLLQNYFLEFIQLKQISAVTVPHLLAITKCYPESLNQNKYLLLLKVHNCWFCPNTG